MLSFETAPATGSAYWLTRLRLAENTSPEAPIVVLPNVAGPAEDTTAVGHELSVDPCPVSSEYPGQTVREFSSDGGRVSAVDFQIIGGQLRDLGSGPLAVEGTVRLTPEPGFDLEGLVTARPTASPELAQDIQFLGSPDARGRRPFSLAATF